jgi:hypothetical protein
VVALAEILVQRFQQPLLGLGGAWPVHQRLLLQVFECLRKPAGLDGHAHGAFAQQGCGAGVQGVEQQSAGR